MFVDCCACVSPQRFIDGDDEFRNSRFKFCCKLVHAPWLVTAAVSNLGGERPAIIGKKLTVVRASSAPAPPVALPPCGVSATAVRVYAFSLCLSLFWSQSTALRCGVLRSCVLPAFLSCRTMSTAPCAFFVFIFSTLVVNAA